jgi:hypothetical protein
MTDEKYLATTINELVSNPEENNGKRVQVEGIARGMVPTETKKGILYTGFLQEEDNLVYFCMKKRYNLRFSPLESLLNASSQSGLAFTFKGKFTSQPCDNGGIMVDSVGYQGYSNVKPNLMEDKK